MYDNGGIVSERGSLHHEHGEALLLHELFLSNTGLRHDTTAFLASDALNETPVIMLEPDYVSVRKALTSHLRRLQSRGESRQC